MKSQYELLIEELKNSNKIETFSGEEHIELMQELNLGLSKFSTETKRNQEKAEKEIKTFYLD